MTTEDRKRKFEEHVLLSAAAIIANMRGDVQLDMEIYEEVQQLGTYSDKLAFVRKEIGERGGDFELAQFDKFVLMFMLE